MNSVLQDTCVDANSHQCNIFKCISQSPEITYELIKIQVLDCRSNEPIRHAKLKEFLLFTNNPTPQIFNKFNFNDKRIDLVGNRVRNAQTALNRLGYYHGTPATVFGKNGKKQYNLYWNHRAPGMVPTVETGNPPDEMLDLIINEYNSHWGTDDNGILTFRIPRNLLDGSAVHIQIRFWEFPVALERIGKTCSAEKSTEKLVSRNEDIFGGGTYFNIVWHGNQSIESDKPFGWTIHNNEERSDFYASLTLPIKNNTDDFKIWSEDLMSQFYSPGDNSNHFTLFALQWCQPVLDGFNDNKNGQVGAITENTYIQDQSYANMKIHLATRYKCVGGSDFNSGKGYGKMEACPAYFSTKFRDSQPPTPGHSGFDIYAEIGAPIFAFHGGKAIAVSYDSHDSNGNLIHNYNEKLKWNPIQSGAYCSITFLHLSNEGRVQNERVLAGQIIGCAGRSGNLGWTSDYPGHTHMNVGSYPNDNIRRYSSNLYETNRDAVDQWNLKLFPSNNLPLMFPCKCQIGNAAQTGAFFSCDFDNDHANTCWAAMELKCPKMINKSNAAGQSQQVRIIQAQLKVLNYYVGNDKTLTNILSAKTKTAIKNYKQNNTAYAGVVNGYPPVSNQDKKDAFEEADDIDDSITPLLCQWLNTEAPLPTL